MQEGWGVGVGAKCAETLNLYFTIFCIVWDKITHRSSPISYRFVEPYVHLFFYICSWWKLACILWICLARFYLIVVYRSLSVVYFQLLFFSLSSVISRTKWPCIFLSVHVFRYLFRFSFLKIILSVFSSLFKLHS